MEVENQKNIEKLEKIEDQKNIEKLERVVGPSPPKGEVLKVQYLDAHPIDANPHPQ